MILTSTMITAAAGFLTNQIILKSKGFETARDEISIETWNWIKAIFIKEGKETIVKKIEQDPEKYKSALEIAIEEIAEKNPDFDEKLAQILEKTASKSKIKVDALEAFSIEVLNKQKGNSEAEFKNLKAEGEIKIDNQQE